MDLNKVLGLFGLMTKGRARQVATELVALQSRMLSEYAQKDFGAKPTPGYEEYIRGWSAENFDVAVRAFTKTRNKLVSYEEYRALTETPTQI